MSDYEVLQNRVNNLDEKVDGLDKRFEKMDLKQENLGESMNKLSLTMKELEITLKNSIDVNRDLYKELKEKMHNQIEKTNEKDSKTVENIKSVIIGALGTGIIGWILVQIGFRK